MSEIELPPVASHASLTKLITELEKVEEDQKAMAGAAKNLVERFHQEHHVHIEAFKHCRKIMGWSPTARAAYLRHLLAYIEELGLDNQDDLFAGEAATAKAGHLKAVS